MDEQRARARAAQKKEIIAASNIDTSHPTQFVGFDQFIANATVLDVVNVKDKLAVTLDVSPLYAEMGGQVGDTGEGAGRRQNLAYCQYSENRQYLPAFPGRQGRAGTGRVSPWNFA
jgi:alanyl-tRNA synthetase